MAHSLLLLSPRRLLTPPLPEPEPTDSSPTSLSASRRRGEARSPHIEPRLELFGSTFTGEMAVVVFITPFVEKLIDFWSQYLKGQRRWQTGMKKELESLQNNYHKIKAVDFASIRAQIGDQHPDFNQCLWQLRDAIDEADDVLDEFAYMNHERQLMKNKKQRKVRFFMKFIKSRLVKVVKRALQIDPNLKRLQEVVKEFDDVLGEFVRFLNRLGIRMEEQRELNQTRQTGSLPTNVLIGRDKEKEFLIQWLMKPSNDHQITFYRNISLLSIVGHGGMGKTTLAQHVYGEMAKDFDLKIWVCVSNNFDAQKVIADMLEYIKKKRYREESLGTLQESLKSEVKSKKFFLVLDDIWAEEECAEEGEKKCAEEEGKECAEEEVKKECAGKEGKEECAGKEGKEECAEEKEIVKNKWQDVFEPLVCGGMGSKILITTRELSVATMIAKVLLKKREETILPLEGLEDDKCLQLLNSYAFAGVESSDDHEDLKSIGGQIVKKLSGSPLAAKVIGGALNESLDDEHWQSILNSDIIHAEPGQNVLSILSLGYTFLPKHLQICFAFCCIFPQDYNFDKDDLVRIWIALGFIPSSYNQERTMEDIGGSCFDDLVRKSFFDKYQIDSKIHYKVHDLLHELAQSVSAEECFRVMSDEELHFESLETIRHLYVESANVEMLKKIGQCKHLRSLFLTAYMDNEKIFNALTEILKSLRSIRSLYIHCSDLKEIPDEIGNLIHLRYLKFDVVKVSRLPRSLSKLYHLRFINYDKRYMLSRLPNDFLPRDMNNLSNLHYLNLPWDDFPGMHGIGKLNSLQELNGFYAKKEDDYTIMELERMNELRQLRIIHLENVKDAEQALNSKLCDKRNLTDLSLEWRGDVIFRRNFANNYLSLVGRVLDNLQPYNSLKKLRIHSFMGIRSAVWMNDANSMSNLEWIELDNCLEWQTLPPFGELPFLKSLYLLDMPKVKGFDSKSHDMPKVKGFDSKSHGKDKKNIFPLLEVLHIRRLEALEHLFDPAATYESLFPSLTELCLEDCPNSKELPYLPPKLKLLQLVNVGWRNLSFCSMSNPFPLETIKVCGCPNLSYIHLAGQIAGLVALRSLTIVDCPSLISLGRHQEVGTSENFQLILHDLSISDPSVLLMEPLRSITSLLKLCISDNDEFVSFPHEVGQWFRGVSESLCELEFTRLKSLELLPSLQSFTSLKILNLFDIPELQSLPYLPASLEQLTLYILKSLQRLPSSLSYMSAFKSMRLSYIPLLESLPELPPSLEHLFIFGCHKKLKERYVSTSGVKRNKLACISFVSI